MSKTIPALSENTFLRYFNFIALYIAQGIPEGIVLFGIPAWMAMNGKTPGEIGSFVAVFGIPWSFKVVVAPLMDRFTYLPMGRRRPWVMFGQFGLIASFIAMAFVPDPLNNIAMLSAAGFAVGFFGAFQDVATDGMAIDIVPTDQQARANGYMWGAKIIGTSASLAIGSVLLNKYGFTPAILSLSIGVGLIMLVPLLLRERTGEKLMPWTKGEASEENIKIQLTGWAIIFKSLYRVFSLRNSLLVALIMFFMQCAYNYVATLLPIFTVQALGWTDQEYSKSFATASLIGGIGGMVIGGILIEKFGKIRMLNIYYITLIILTAVFVFLKSTWTSSTIIFSYMVIYQIMYVFTCIGLFAVSMQCCWKKVSASQFTIYMTIGNMGRIVGAKMIGPMKLHFSWEYTVLLFSGLLFIGLVTIQFLHINNHLEHVNKLDKKYSEGDLGTSLSKI